MSDHRLRKQRRLERLGRFLDWAGRTHPDFVAKQQHQELWFKPYGGYPLPHLGRIAKAFWLGLDEATAVSAGSAPEAETLLGQALLNASKTFGYPVDVFGSEQLFTAGAASELLEPHWALNLADSDSAGAFELAVRQRLGAAVRERLGVLAGPFGEMAAEDRQRVLQRVPQALIRLDDFLPRAVEVLNETRHELRFNVVLTHEDIRLEIPRRLAANQGRLLSDADVAALKAEVAGDLRQRFAVLVSEADALDFDLHQLGLPRLQELMRLETDKLRRALRHAVEQQREKMAFAVLLENNPRFAQYHQNYPARRLTRTWTALLGPTNSGKTHRSIEAMAAVTHAIYLSPLRLMALENQERLESLGVPCSLVTGEEEIIRPGATHFCCTVEEFARFRRQQWEVVVVDEVQMLADPQRGWAWVDALVSAHTRRLLMTGPALIEPSLRTLCTLCEDRLEIKPTKRLSPVTVARHATTLERLEPGSLLVAFSRRVVLELKGLLEMAGRRVSVVYGALSPEVRREQARRFREGETEIMVATDAVGMGLNLPAHTLCFYTDEKFDGVQNRPLRVQEVKQIGGRAGRFGHHAEGEITALEPHVLRNIKRLFHSPDDPVDLHQFQVRPSLEHLRALSEFMQEPSLLRTWLTFNRNINYGDAFVSVLPDELAEWIKLIDLPGIDFHLRWIFACTPIRGGLEGPASGQAQRWLRSVARGEPVDLPRIPLGTDLAGLESALHVVETYLHLARSLPELFPALERGEDHRDLLNEAITRELSRRRRPRGQEKGQGKGGRRQGRGERRGGRFGR